MSLPQRRGARPIFLAPLGIHTRYMLASYLRHILMVVAALMTIALTIDLWPQVALLPGSGPLAVLDVIKLAALRLPDLLPPFLPFATFLGVVWSESTFTESRERMLVWNSGRSPLLCLVPAALVGLAMGATLFVVDALLRPAAIHVQIAEKLGREGIRLDRSQSGGNHWIALQDGLLRAEIEYGPPARLRNTTIYKLDSQGHLYEVDTAARATPQSNGRWLLEDGHYWRADFADQGNVLSTGPTSQEAELPFRTRTIVMVLNEQWLRNLGLSPQYLRLGELKTLSRAHLVSRDEYGYRTRLQAVYSEPLLAIAMALLGASLSMLFFAYRTRWRALVGVLLAGYLAHFASRAFYLMGEFGYISSVMATWVVPALLLAAAAGVLVRIQQKRGLGITLQDAPELTS
jgi:lipopolysaccharide export system permease protein